MVPKKEDTKQTRKDREKALPGSQTALLLGALLLITLISFSPVLRNGFINWDDNAHVFSNSDLKRTLPYAINHFFGPHYYIGNYIPVTMLTYALEYHVAGLQPGFFHTVNLLLHLANILLVFLFFFSLTNKNAFVAAFVAAFFGLHPMHVESVAWVSELKDLLYTFFFFGGLISYLRYLNQKKTAPGRTRRGIYLFLLTFGCFTLSVLSKPAAVIFPVVLLLLDCFYGGKFNRNTWLEKLPFFTISLIIGLVTLKAQQADNLLHSDHSVFQKLFFSSSGLLLYIIKFLLPVNLAIFYPYPLPVNGQLPWLYYVAPVALALLAYLGYRLTRRDGPAAFGLLFFLATTVLVLQIISFGDAIIAERYTYISYTGLLFTLGLGVERLYTNQKKTFRQLTLTVLALFLGLCAWQTHERSKVWHNDLAMATDLLDKFPDDRLALNNKGFVLYELGRFSESVALFQRALTLKPDYAMAHINLVNTFISLKDSSSARMACDEGLRFLPHNSFLLLKKGYLLTLLRDYQGALSNYNRALQEDKENLDCYIYLAECYYYLKDFDQGIHSLDKGLQLYPDNYLLLNNKGYFLYLMGKYQQAIEYFEASLRCMPGYSTAMVNLDNCRQVLAKPAQQVR